MQTGVQGLILSEKVVVTKFTIKEYIHIHSYYPKKTKTTSMRTLKNVVFLKIKFGLSFTYICRQLRAILIYIQLFQTGCHSH